MPPSPFQTFGVSVNEAARSLNQAMNQLVLFVRRAVNEKFERENRIRMAPDVLRQVVAPQLNEEARVLIWELANDLEQYMAEQEHEDDGASLADGMKKHLKRGSGPDDVRATQSASSTPSPGRR